jgi:hypothetical protein
MDRAACSWCRSDREPQDALWCRDDECAHLLRLIYRAMIHYKQLTIFGRRTWRTVKTS